MDYSEEEIQAAVEALVLSSVTTNRDNLGARDLGSTFNQMQEAAAGVFLLYFNAPFYVAYLGVQRVLELVASTAEIAQEVIEAIAATGRTTFPVEDLTSLANASVALGELSSAVSARSKGFEDIEVVPAWRRYAQNVESFIETNGRNIKRGGAIVQTPDQARGRLPGLITALQEGMELLSQRVQLMAVALDDFGSLNLPSVAAAGVIARARDKLSSRYEELQALDDSGRLEILRDVNLDLLSQKAIVKKYGAAQKPTPYHVVEGTASAYSDATHLASPASLTATGDSPHIVLETNNTLGIAMDGGAVKNFPFPLSPVAELTGIVQEPYVIDSTNDVLELELGAPGAGSTFVVLTNGTRTAQQVATEITAAMAGSDFIAETAFYPLKIETIVNITNPSANVGRFTIIAGSFDDLNIKVGDVLEVMTGANAGTQWTLTTLDPGGTWLEGQTSPLTNPTVQTNQTIRVGPAARVVTIRDDIGDSTSVAQRRLIRFISDGGGVHDYAARAIGFAPELYARSAPTFARYLRDAINASLASPRADLELVEVVQGFGRTNLDDPASITLYRSSLTAVFTWSSGVGTFTNYVLEQGTAPVVGEGIIIRTGVNTGRAGIITSVSSTVITASFVVGASDPAIKAESGIFTYDYGWVLEITSGPNRGQYMVLDGPQGTDPFQVPVQFAPPVLKFGDEPLTFTARFAFERLKFLSTDKTIDSKIVLSGPAVSLLFISPPGPAIGETTYLQLTKLPAALSLGDVFELYESQYNEVSRSATVVGIDRSINVIQLSEAFESDLSVPLGTGTSPTPFARLRIGQVASYTRLKARLENWVGLSVNQGSFFTNLNRLVNPLLVNKNPTAVAVRDAGLEVQELLSYLTVDGATTYGIAGSGASTASVADALEQVLNEYVVDPVEPVDVLLKSLRERGADRAIDTLLQGEFSRFFGLSMSGMSYSGNLQESARELAREDLPMRKYNRSAFFGERLLSTSTEKDYEFDLSDADADIAPDPTPATG
jgi:hypothetical protein